jgi:Na+-driven multidrug efflux pump
VIDLMMVGSISPEAIAAVGMGGTLFWNLSVLFGGPAVAVLYLCGQSWGRSDRGAFSRRAAAGLILSVVLSAGFALFPAMVSRFLYQAMGAADNVVEQGVRYFQFRMLGFRPGCSAWPWKAR